MGIIFPQGTTTLGATLSGTQESQPNNSPGTGTAMVCLKPELGIICWILSVSDLSETVTAAHIQNAPPGLNGPVVVTLTRDPFTGTLTGCTQASQSLLTDIEANPGNYYMNVHTIAFPGGEIRGQLMS